MMEIVLIKTDSKEYEYLWDFIENHPLNKGIENPKVALNQDEHWRYIGTITDGKRYIHTVQHTCHPYDNQFKEVSIDASKDFDVSDITERFKLISK